jgi:tRNA-dihydrouridine synthase B
MRIGSFSVSGRLIAAPMAGITDRPFRSLCRRLGASFAVSEMVSSNPRLRSTDKSRLRIDHAGESEPRWVQIAGADPREMAEAARYSADAGAQIIDINMGCPAKKVCNRAAGSALLSNEPLIARILDAVVAASPVPVTLKIRTGPEPANRNGVRVARIAERAGVAAISVHGRSRACAFRGRAEHDTVRRIKSAVKMPVIANGDISSPESARQVLQHTGADALMIGRASQGNPWIFREVSHYLVNGTALPGANADEVGETLVEHLEALHEFYGGFIGLRVARKHLSWYLRSRAGGAALWSRINRVENPSKQLRMVRDFFRSEKGQLAASTFALGENAA